MQSIIVYAITSGSVLLLCLVTLTTPGKANVRANQWLSFFLYSFACIMLDHTLFGLDVYNTYPAVNALLEAPRFAMSPALYFSVVYFTTPERKFKSYDYLHFVPFFLFFLFILTVIFHINNTSLFAWYHDLSSVIRRAVAWTVFISLKVQMIAYWLLSYAQLLKHRRNIGMFASTLEPISLSWLRYFLLGLVVALFLSLNDGQEWIPAILPFTSFGYLILTFYMGYFWLRQQEIYPYPDKEVGAIRDILETNTKTARTQRFTPDELSPVKQKLMTVMETEKVYLDPDLGLPELAAKVGLSTHDLSFVINEGFQENFFQFVNRYRIEEAKVLLRSPHHKHLNILGIAYEVGFRSKSTFNTTFKKLTGQSPSYFSKGLDSSSEGD